MAEKQPPTPLERYRVDAGFDEGQPYVAITDRLANAGLRLPLIDALKIAAAMTGAGANLMEHMREQARKQRDRSLLVAKK